MADDKEPGILTRDPADAASDAEPADGDEAGASDAAEAAPEPEPESEPEAEAEAESAPTLTPAVRAKPTPLRKKTAAPTFYVAGFWRRLGAALVDLAIIIPVSYLLCWLAGTITGISLPDSRHHGLDFWLDLLLASDPALIGGIGLTLAIGAIYALVFQITTAATPGMRLLKTRIIDIYGDPPSTARSLARTGGYLAGVATLALGFLWIGFDSEKRGLHDWISGTYVVKS